MPAPHQVDEQKPDLEALQSLEESDPKERAAERQAAGPRVPAVF